MTAFTCPFCQSPITIANKTWFCDGSLNEKATKHPFDVAKQGYVNLLPVQNKKSKSPGDSAASILARQQFLQAGFYQPLQVLVSRLISDYLANTTQTLSDKDNVRDWLDVGCGEGYYSLAIARSQYIDRLLAVDISKSAVMALAKSAKQQQMLWLQSQSTSVIPLVASASDLPLASQSVEGVSSIFSPILPDELARVIKNDGLLVIAKPDEGHLDSVRAGLFDTVREHNSDKFLEQLVAVGFELVHTERLTTQLTLDNHQLANLLTMTPYSYRAKREKREQLLRQAKQSGLMTQGRFVVYVLRKRP